MPKVLEDSLGNLQYLMAALTLLGVMYLCYKQGDLHVNLSNAAAKGAAAGAASRQGFAVDANTMRWYGGRPTHPGSRGGFAGSMNAVGPDFWSTATEMDQLAGVAIDEDAIPVTWEDVTRVQGPNDAVSKYKTKWTTEGMKNPLAAAFTRSLDKLITKSK